MKPAAAAQLALDGNYRQRLHMRDDLHHREVRDLMQRFRELQPSATRGVPMDTAAPEQLDFWRENLPQPSFVYFIQVGDTGPVKIGLSTDPARRIGDLQIGNHRDLALRHVIPGNEASERQLHHRFRAARIKGEWFGGRVYLAIILMFAAGLSDEMIHAYDGSGHAPALASGQVRSASELERMRREILRVYRDEHGLTDMSQYLLLEPEEIEEQLAIMCKSSLYGLAGLTTEELLAGRNY